MATSRADVFYPYGPGVTAADGEVFGTNQAPAYPEASIPDPVDGRRVQIAAIATATGTLVDAPVLRSDDPDDPGLTIRRAFLVEIGGRPAHELLDEAALDWLRVWPRDVVEGEPIWVAFHTRDPDWSSEREPLTLRVPTDGGDAINTTISAEPAAIRINMVQPSQDLKTVWIHAQNTTAADRSIMRIVVNGQDVSHGACLADPILSPGETALIEVALDTPWQLGAAWTVVLEDDTDHASAAVGRVLPTHFPIHAWPSSRDCPLPGINDQTFNQHQAAGFDTFFSRSRYRASGCNDLDVSSILHTTIREAGVFVMADEGLVVPPEARDVAHVRLIGDEVDNTSLQSLIGVQKMRQKAEEATHYNTQAPEMAVYVGGSRHRFTGMFAGSTDIQGMDFYVDGCAPHITDFGAHPPLRGAYDYLRATRDNHLPNPTWLYTQGVSDAWRGVVPGPTGAIVQAWSVIAAGGKGLMTFQTVLEDAEERPDTWQALTRVNHSVAALRPWLRLGDPTDAATTQDDAIVEALRVPGGLVLVVIGLTTSQGPAELECLGPVYTEWRLEDMEVRVELELPDDVGVDGWFEVVDGAGVPVSDAAPPTVDGRLLTFTGIPLTDQRPVRVFVLHDDPALPEALLTP